MQFRKLAAAAGSALMAGLSIAGPALAGDVTTVGDFNSLVSVEDGTVAFPMIVVGATSAASDIAGGINLGVRLAAEAGEDKVIPGQTVAVVGTSKNTIAIASRLSSVMPDPIKAVHFTGLKDTTFTWSFDSNTYDYSEQIDFAGTSGGTAATVEFSHDFAKSNINGTEKMVVPTSSIIYEYVFDKTLTGVGTVATPIYNDTVKASLMGETYEIVGVSSNQVKILFGTTGTASTLAGEYTNGITYGDYTVYVDSTVTDGKATFTIKDADGNTVETLRVDTEGSTQTATAAGISVKLIDSTAYGSDPATARYEAKIVVGPKGETEKTLTTSCSTGQTGSSNVDFPGTTDWCIQVSGFATAGVITNADKIQVVYKPSSTQYLVAGESISLPNSYADITYEGWNINTFTELTVEPVNSVSVYYKGNDTTLNGARNGIQFSVTPGGSLWDPWVGSGGAGYDKVALLFNDTLTSNPSADSAHYPVMLAFWDSSKSRYEVDFGTVPGGSTSITTGPAYTTGNVYFRQLNNSNGEQSATIKDLPERVNQFYNFTLNVSYQGGTAVNQQHIIFGNVSVGNTTWDQSDNTSTVVNTIQIGTGNSAVTNPIQLNYKNRTAWNSGAPEFVIGAVTNADATDIYINSTGEQGTAASVPSASLAAAGSSTQNIVTDSGAILVSPATWTAADKAKIKIPSETLYVKASVGKAPETTEDTTYKEAIAVTADVAKLDTEVTEADKAASDFVVVGGPAVNSLAAELLGVPAGTRGVDSTIPENAALVQVFADQFAEGRVAVLVAGWEAGETELAARVLQTGRLDDSEFTAVKLTGTAAATATIEEYTTA